MFLLQIQSFGNTPKEDLKDKKMVIQGAHIAFTESIDSIRNNPQIPKKEADEFEKSTLAQNYNKASYIASSNKDIMQIVESHFQSTMRDAGFTDSEALATMTQMFRQYIQQSAQTYEQEQRQREEQRNTFMGQSVLKDTVLRRTGEDQRYADEAGRKSIEDERRVV